MATTYANSAEAVKNFQLKKERARERKIGRVTKREIERESTVFASNLLRMSLVCEIIKASDIHYTP